MAKPQKKGLEKFVVIEKDAKEEVLAPTAGKPSTLLHNRAGGARGKISKIKTKLVISGSVASSANTALTTVIKIDPSASNEWASFTALFDEVKVLGGTMHYHVATAGGAPVESDFALAYDPTNGGVYTGIAGVLVADQCQLRRGTITSLTAVLESPQPVTASGFWQFPFKCPEAPQKVASNVLVDSEVCTGLWADTTNSVTPTYGYIKPYAPAVGASVVFAIYYYITLDCLFRSRS